MVALLLALIAALTGIPRNVDADLTAIAERRVIEVSCGDSCFNHDGAVPGLAEVLAWNLDFEDPATHAVEQWQGSPEHWAILTDPSYGSIGCGHTHAADGRDYWACVLAPGPYVAPTEPPVLPNTAMEHP